MKTVDPTLLNDADFAEQVTLERVERPVKVWLNWWRSLTDRPPCPDCGGIGFSGEVYSGCCGDEGFPSKDVAETVAAELIADEAEEYGANYDDYLGAFPEGERP